MKKVLILLCVIVTVILASCGESKEMYTKEEMQEAIAEAESVEYKRGFEDGYDLAKYEAKGELERFKSEYGDSAYEAGYEVGYEDGFSDGRYG